MNHETTDSQLHEQSLVQLYMNLTGTTESHARNVFMYLNCEEPGLETSSSLLPMEPVSPSRPLAQ